MDAIREKESKPDHVHAWIELQFVKNKIQEIILKQVKYKSIKKYALYNMYMQVPSKHIYMYDASNRTT